MPGDLHSWLPGVIGAGIILAHRRRPTGRAEGRGMKLQGRVAIITGASSGVGYETARLLAREGALVAAAARRRDKLEWLVGEIASDGGQAIAFPTDVTDSEQINRLIEGAHNLFGRIDILVNSAGVML